jgi:uncharacterized protein (DUF488 family)
VTGVTRRQSVSAVAPPRAVIWTIGHGTRRTDELAALLQAAGVSGVIDVRRYPTGRRQPNLSQARLEVDFPAQGLTYEWWGRALGGRRPAPDPTLPPSRWRSPAFAAYEAYTLTATFREAILELEERVTVGQALALMCAETLWWRCHRRLIADALVSKGFEVRHLIDRPPGAVHPTSAIWRDQAAGPSSAIRSRRARLPAKHSASSEETRWPRDLTG